MSDDVRARLAVLPYVDILALYGAERFACDELISQIDDEQWVSLARADGWTIHDLIGHMGDSLGGMTHRLATMTAGDGTSDVATARRAANDNGFDMDAFNEQRRQKARALSRQTISENLAKSFAYAEKTARAWPGDQLDTPGPFGMTVRAWLATTILHTQGHRLEVAGLLHVENVPAH